MTSYNAEGTVDLGPAPTVATRANHYGYHCRQLGFVSDKYQELAIQAAARWVPDAPELFSDPSR